MLYLSENISVTVENCLFFSIILLNDRCPAIFHSYYSAKCSEHFPWYIARVWHKRCNARAMHCDKFLLHVMHNPGTKSNAMEICWSKRNPQNDCFPSFARWRPCLICYIFNETKFFTTLIFVCLLTFTVAVCILYQIRV